jgi:hypothetical protein
MTTPTKDWSGFLMSPIEQEAATRFVKRHRCPLRRLKQASTTYEFTPTGIGVAIHVSCACGQRRDITDYDHW